MQFTSAFQYLFNDANHLFIFVDKAMEKLSATRKPAVSAARYRSNVLNRAEVTTHTKVDEQKTGGTSKVENCYTVISDQY